MIINRFYLGAILLVISCFTFILYLDHKYTALEYKYQKIIDKIDKIDEKMVVPMPVKTKDYIPYSKMDMYCLAKNIYYEAGVETYVGKLAVAQVTLNRLRNGRWGNDICSVVYSRGQFSWTYEKDKRWVRPSGKNWIESQRVAKEFLNNAVRVKGLENAEYYHADYVNPRWAKHKDKITKIGAHIFYSARDT